MTLGELLAAIPPATYVFIAIDRQHPGRAEGTIYGPREDLKIPQDLERRRPLPASIPNVSATEPRAALRYL